MKAIVSSAVLIAAMSVLSGCSNDPTSEDFKEFAEGYAKEASGEQARKGHGNVQVLTELVSFDLRKTDSLTSPYEGEAKFKVSVKGVTIYDIRIPGGFSDATYTNETKLLFGWADGKWTHKGGEAQIVGVEFPGLTESQTFKLPKMFNDSKSEVTAKASEDRKAWFLNGYASVTAEQFKKRYIESLAPKDVENAPIPKNFLATVRMLSEISRQMRNCINANEKAKRFAFFKQRAMDCVEAMPSLATDWPVQKEIFATVTDHIRELDSTLIPLSMDDKSNPQRDLYIIEQTDTIQYLCGLIEAAVK
jgi:hypothetical protein